MAQSSIHHRQNALWRGLWMLFSCDWTIACTSGKSRPLRNEAWSSDPPKWYIDTLFFTWSAMTGLLECGILYFSTYSKLCKTQYTHITHMQHDTVLFVLNNACLRPRNTGIIAMSWPQKITSSSSELIKLVQLCQLECTAVCNPPGKIFNCFRACDKVSAERGTLEMIWWYIIRPPGEPVWTINGHAIFNFTASQQIIIFTADRKYIGGADFPVLIWLMLAKVSLFVVHTSFIWRMIHHDGRLGVTNYAITHVLLRVLVTIWRPWYTDTGSDIVKPNLDLTQSNMGQYFILQNVELGTAE